MGERPRARSDLNRAHTSGTVGSGNLPFSSVPLPGVSPLRVSGRRSFCTPFSYKTSPGLRNPRFDRRRIGDVLSPSTFRGTVNLRLRVDASVWVPQSNSLKGRHDRDRGRQKRTKIWNRAVLGLYFTPLWNRCGTRGAGRFTTASTLAGSRQDPPGSGDPSWTETWVETQRPRPVPPSPGTPSAHSTQTFTSDPTPRVLPGPQRTPEEPRPEKLLLGRPSLLLENPLRTKRSLPSASRRPVCPDSEIRANSE